MRPSVLYPMNPARSMRFVSPIIFVRGGHLHATAIGDGQDFGRNIAFPWRFPSERGATEVLFDIANFVE